MVTVLRPRPYDPAFVDRLWPDTTRYLPNDAIEMIASHAAASDRAGTISETVIDELRASNYFGLAVPSEFEGAGAPLLDCCAVQKRIGYADAALAVALNMHLFSVGLIVEHWHRERDSSWVLLEAIATQRRLVASGFAEPGLAGSVLRSNFDVQEVRDGYIVSGTKTPCSLGRRSDLICLQIQKADGGSNSLMVCLIPTQSPGIRIETTWDPLGMRASESDSVHFESCFIPERLVFHRCAPGFDADPIFASGLTWFCATTTAGYIGLAQAALDQLATILGRSRVDYLNAFRIELPSVQAAVGDVATTLVALEMACIQLAHLHDDQALDPRDLLPAALSVKQQAIGTVLGVVAAASELGGSATYSRKLPLERMWRDAQAIQYHPPPRAATRQLIGRWWLGQPFTFELDEQPNSRGVVDRDNQ